MYFSNISNGELQHCHKLTGVNINMSLTDILKSNLFKVEQITNNIYRIYPLFYCKNILSTNSKDIILDNKCIILMKEEKETYISFTSNENYNNYVVDDSLFNLKGIGDNLSIDEFNGFVYLLRNKTKLRKSGNLNDEEFVGDYGTYIINNVSDQLKNGMGIIINDKIKNDPITIKLTNPFFINARYILTFTVQTITGANIINDESFDYITKTSFNVELVEGVEVPLNLSKFTNDSVLLYEFEVEVDFSINEIVNSKFGIDLSSNSNRIILGNNLILTANLSGEDNVRGYLVHFYEDNNLIGAEVTDNDGKAVLEYLPSLGNHVYSCEVLGLSDTIKVVVNRYDTTLTLESSKTTAYIPTTFNVSGVLSNEVGTVANTTINLYNNNVIVETEEPIITDSNGYFEYEFNANTNANYNIRASFETNGINNGCDSNTVSVVARKLNTNITISADKSTVYYTQSTTISGVLKDELGNIMTNANITLYNGDTYVNSAVTHNDGSYAFVPNLAEYDITYNFKAVYIGDDTHNSVTSAIKAVKYQKAPTSIVVDKSDYNANENVKIKVNSNYGTFNPTTINYEIFNENNMRLITGTLSTKDSDGYFSFKLPELSSGQYTLIVSYGGDTNYQSSILNKVINVTNPRGLNKITISKSGNALIMNFKNSNNQNLANYDIIGTRITAGQTTFDIGTSTLTNSKGNSQFDNFNIIASTGTKVVVTLNEVTSNTLIW